VNLFSYLVVQEAQSLGRGGLIVVSGLVLGPGVDIFVSEVDVAASVGKVRVSCCSSEHFHHHVGVVKVVHLEYFTSSFSIISVIYSITYGIQSVSFGARSVRSLDNRLNIFRINDCVTCLEIVGFGEVAVGLELQFFNKFRVPSVNQLVYGVSLCDSSKEVSFDLLSHSVDKSVQFIQAGEVELSQDVREVSWNRCAFRSSVSDTIVIVEHFCIVRVVQPHVLVSIAGDVRYLVSIKHRGITLTCVVINITIVVILRLFSA